MEHIAALDECAISVIDVQNDFCAAGGAMHRLGRNVENMSRMLPSLAAFLRGVRSLGGKIVFTRHRFEPDQLTPTLLERNRNLFGGDGFPMPGSWGEGFCSPVGPVDGEAIFSKYRYSAFSNPKFGDWLDRCGVKTLVLAGVLTNVCVETTARESDSRDFYVVVVEDCVASDSKELHRATLANIQQYFGWVCTSEELLTLWARP
jgi:ureidoacrylate peracid hydrolase